MLDKTDAIEIHGIALRPGTNEAFVEGRSLLLTKTEFRLLHYLASRAGNVHTRQQIINAVQGPDYPATDRPSILRSWHFARSWTTMDASSNPCVASDTVSNAAVPEFQASSRRLDRSHYEQSPDNWHVNCVFSHCEQHELKKCVAIFDFNHGKTCSRETSHDDV